MSRLPSLLVAATDFSPASREALDYALRLARETRAAIHLLHVISWPDAGPFEVPGDALTAHAEAAEEMALADAALAAEVQRAAGSSASAVVRAVRISNTVAREIGAYARDVHADLVVLGTCGMHDRGDWLGAVSGEGIHTAPCDVLLVPYVEEAPFSARPVGRVLVPVDFSPASPPLVELGVELSAAFDAAGVDLAHVLEPLPYPLRWIDETVLDLAPEIQERAGTALRGLANEAAGSARESGLDLGLYVERGKASRTLARLATALDSSLIVVGPHDERPVFDGLLGSVAEGVARRVTRPVWIARHTADGTGDDLVDRQSYEASAVDPEATV